MGNTISVFAGHDTAGNVVTKTVDAGILAPSPAPSGNIGPQVDAGGGPIEATVNPYNGEPEAKKVHTAQYDPSKTGNGLQGILATGRNWGGPIFSADDIRPDTLFKIGSMEINADQAAQHGFLVKHKDGSYSLPAQGQPQSQEQDQKQPELINHLSNEVQTTLAQLDQRFSGNTGVTDALVSTAVAHIAAGDWEKAYTEFVQRTGAEPAHATEVLNGVFANARHSAAQHITKTFQVSGEAVFDWIAANVKDKALISSLTHRIFVGDNRAFAEAVNMYKKGTAFEDTKKRMGLK